MYARKLFNFLVNWFVTEKIKNNNKMSEMSNVQIIQNLSQVKRGSRAVSSVC